MRIKPSGRRGRGVRSGWLAALCLSSCTLLPYPAHAGEGDFFRPLLNAAYYHDSNLFRFSGDSVVPPLIAGESTGNRIQSVNYNVLGAGFLLDWQQSRQRVQARAQANRVRFSRYSALLDYDGHELNALWDWQLGNRWRGQLGAERSKTLGSYDNVGIVQNTRTDTRYNLRAVRDLHTDWQAEFRYNHAASEYANQPIRDVDTDALALGVYRLGGTLQRLGVELRHTDIQRPAGTLSDAAEWGVFGVATWQASGKTRLRGRLGFIDRDYERAATRGFRGIEGRVDVDWSPTGKTLVNAALYRELTETDLGVNTNYRRETGLSLGGQWLVMPKTRVGAFLRVESHAYDGSNVDDNYRSHGLNATYQPWPGADITLSMQRATRDSSLAVRDFNANAVSLAAVLTF